MMNPGRKPTKLVLVNQSPYSHWGSGEKSMAYASFALLAFLRKYIPNDLQHSFHGKVIDFSHDDEPTTMASVINAEAPSIVGLTAYIWNSTCLLEVARIIKASSPQTILIAGGPQVSPMAMDIAMQNPYLDAVAFSPINGELILLSFVENIMRGTSLSHVPGIVFRNEDHQFIESKAMLPDLNFNTLPSPYELEEEIFSQDKEYMAAIETSRGCPYGCGFCFWDKGRRRVEYFPLARCFSDIEKAYNNPKAKTVHINDANFLTDSVRAEKILHHIMKQKSIASTIIAFHFEDLTEATAKLMGSLPGFRFALSIQTTNPAALDCVGGYRRFSNAAFFTEKLNLLKKWVPEATLLMDLMLGLPEDTYNGFMETLDFCLAIEPSDITVNYPVYLLPGSRFFDQRDKLGIICLAEPPYPIIETKSFPKSEIEKAVRFYIWMRILTFYYPVIARIFFRLGRRDGQRIKRLQKWIGEFEKKAEIMSPHEEITDYAILSIKDWNNKKMEILRKASKVRVASILYDGILRLEETFLTDDEKKSICSAMAIFDYLSSEHENLIGYNKQIVIPSRILHGLSIEEAAGFFSIVKESS